MIPNPQQQAIVDHVDGPCLVTAVPGSGKTASITERTRNLLRLGKDPASILAITFTNKAADEMRSRIGKVVGEALASKMTVCTFHSLCARIIREHAGLLGLRHNYTIYNSDAQEKLVKRCIYLIEGDDFGISDKYMNGILGYIEEVRNSCTPDTETRRKHGIDGNQPKVIEAYFSELRKGNAIDFTGLLSETNRLLDENPAIRDAYRAKWRYISVDEVQDTNVAQYRLIWHLAGGHKNVVVVGDYHQSIYKFRGAAPENLATFEKDFGAKVLRLETNYRSTPDILRHSQALIEKNPLLHKTQLRTDNPKGDQPIALLVDDESKMADEIAKEVVRRLRAGTPPSEVAILYRVNHVSRVLEMALKKYRIKYRIVGGLSFWDRKEVKLSLGILKFISNHADRMSFESLIEACCRGIGPKGIQAVCEKAEADGENILASCINMVDQGAGLAKNLESTVSVMRQPIPPSAVLRGLVLKTAFGDKLDKDSTMDNDRRANVEELARDLEDSMAKGMTLVNYLQGISLLADGDEDSSAVEIKLMTMHACKGLEFDVVFISHACDGIIPHKRSLEEAAAGNQIEEERRLMYVAMTRARKLLRLFFSAKCGKDDMQASRFIREAGLPVYRLKV